MEFFVIALLGLVGLGYAANAKEKEFTGKEFDDLEKSAAKREGSLTAQAPTVTLSKQAQTGAMLQGAVGQISAFTTLGQTANKYMSNMFLPTPKPGAQISTAQADAIGKSQQAAGLNKPGLIIITNPAAIDAWAQVMAANVMAISGGTPPRKPEADVTQTVFLIDDKQLRIKIDSMANQLVSIAGIKTSGEPNWTGIGHQPPYWVPVNSGVPPFDREGDNLFTVPTKTVGEIVQAYLDNCPVVQANNINYRNCTNMITELSTLYAISWTFKYILSKDKSGLQRAIDLAVKVATAAVAGASAGWIGAVGGAVAALVADITAQLDKAIGKDGVERDAVARITRTYQQSLPQFVSPLAKLGYEFTSKVAADKVHAFPANLWFQSAPHATLVSMIEQGVYPGCGLRAYMGASTERFNASVDGADMVSGSSWNTVLHERSAVGDKYNTQATP